jgi:hypothetical protein
MLVLANALGIGLFLLLASTFWIEPELADVPGANGGAAFGWIATAVPIGLAFIIADLCWFAALWSGTRRIAALVLTAILLMCWAAAFVMDNMHHGI